MFATDKELQFCPGDECSDFHGWEYAMVKLIGAPTEIWFKMNREYTVSLDETPDNYIEFWELDEINREKYLNQALERAKNLKILDDDYKPLSIR